MDLSVALCTFNGGPHLPTQLGSLSAQSRLPDELIACDDASSDDTASILHAFAESASFPVKVYVNPTRLGTAANFSRAFSLCRGDVILPCDQDDYWLPGKVALFATALSDSSIGLAFSDAILADVRLARTNQTAWGVLPFPPRLRRRIARDDGARILARYNVVTGSAMAFRAELLDAILPIPHDWIPDAWAAFLAAAFSKVRPLEAPTILYRRHESQQVGLSRRTFIRQVRAALSGRDKEYYDRTAARFGQLVDRLERHRHRLRNTAVLETAVAKAALARTQSAMREVNRFDRAAAAWDTLLTGQYFRLDHGFKAFLADLLGP